MYNLFSVFITFFFSFFEGYINISVWSRCKKIQSDKFFIAGEANPLLKEISTLQIKQQIVENSLISNFVGKHGNKTFG